jgi:hypothetical protein
MISVSSHKVYEWNCFIDVFCLDAATAIKLSEVHEQSEVQQRERAVPAPPALRES